jgi:chemotaxis protein histidine kinase CheA
MSTEVLRVIKAICDYYNLVESEALEVCNVNVKSVKSVKSVVKSEVPLPFNGSVNMLNCVALRKNHGLYTQCEGKKEKDVEYCKSCDKKMKKMGSSVPEYGTIMLRSEVGLMEYVDPSGGKAIHYTKVMKKLKLSREQVEEEGKKMGMEILECHFLEEDKKRGRPKGEEKVKKEGKKGRPKKEKTVIEEVEEEDPEDLFAKLVLEASKEIAEEALSEVMDELVVDEEVADEKVVYEVVVDEKKEVSELEKVVHKAIKKAVSKKEVKPTLSKEEREAAKEAEKVAKEAEKAAKEAAKEAEKAAKEAEKEAKKEAERLAKEAAKEVKKEMERLAKEALKSEKASEKVKKPKAEKKVEKVEEVEVAKVEEVEVAKVEEVEVEKVEEADVVKKIKFEGKQYLKSKKSGIVYDYDVYVLTGDQVMVGTWNEEKKCIMFINVFSDSEEEEEEEYEA